MNKLIFTILCLGLIAMAQAQPLSPVELQDQPVYTSLDEALKNPEQVYRLKLKGEKKWDTIPNKLFLLTNLQELTIVRCGLMQVNQQIEKLQNLQYLDVSRNKLITLPESIGNLQELKTLIINRNMIEYLPDGMGKLKKLESIDAWDNHLYVLPKSMAELAETLKVIDLRQIPLRAEELDYMELLLPKTKIYYTSLCECKDSR